MAGFFCDSSAIAKRYISETGTSWLIGLMRLTAKNEFVVAQITGVEVVSAIALDAKLSKLGLPPFIFLSADNNLNSAANVEGLMVDNPNNH